MEYIYGKKTYRKNGLTRCDKHAKKVEYIYMSELRTYHNHVRPHLGLPDKQIPSAAAGIIVGNDKIMTRIQAVAKAGHRFDSRS